jgi:hypothetical protein
MGRAFVSSLLEYAAYSEDLTLGAYAEFGNSGAC